MFTFDLFENSVLTHCISFIHLLPEIATTMTMKKIRFTDSVHLLLYAQLYADLNRVLSFNDSTTSLIKKKEQSLT